MDNFHHGEVSASQNFAPATLNHSSYKNDGGRPVSRLRQRIESNNRHSNGSSRSIGSLHSIHSANSNSIGSGGGSGSNSSGRSHRQSRQMHQMRPAGAAPFDSLELDQAAMRALGGNTEEETSQRLASELDDELAKSGFDPGSLVRGNSQVSRASEQHEEYDDGLSDPEFMRNMEEKFRNALDLDEDEDDQVENVIANEHVAVDRWKERVSFDLELIPAVYQTQVQPGTLQWFIRQPQLQLRDLLSE
ncbi:hypothetical protein GQ42DRAFT_156940 [Ramicandelaber brevisporus]|nr:hypothetical protein GQ42DRAFT_159348 [Ramicandelaber brevisporus]KAI8868599.1 hypothetical protein GQ42DRAFT_156940 [Ramicandelaber brevisporus]